jgi:hypothetical protein
MIYANIFRKFIFIVLFLKGGITTSRKRKLFLLLLLTFDGENKPRNVGYVRVGAKISHKSNFPIMSEISAVGQSHNHDDDANFDFVRQ